MNIKITDEKVAKKIKLACAYNGKTIQDFVTSIVSKECDKEIFKFSKG